MLTLKNTRKFIFGLLFCLLSAGVLAAQTTIFTYQGRLTDSAGTAASYDFEFRLFSVESGSAALATTQRFAVPVSGNVFTVRLDFGANFDGQPRWLEIAVKPAGSANPFTVLNPRQPLDSAPYAIRSLNSQSADTAINSTQLGGVAANQFVQTGDSRLTDARNPLAGSNNYIQNTFLPQQANASFNISGLGTVGSTFTANLVRSNTQFDIGLSRVLSVPGTNTFVGKGSGFANTSGADNSFYGFDSGKANTTGNVNSFFGKFAGDSNTDGLGNSFFGSSAGASNNAGDNNSFFGRGAGLNNSSGGNNTFIGFSAGDTNILGSNNTFIGANANTTGGGPTLTFATAVGAGAFVGANNTVALGRSNGSDKVVIYGLGAAGSTSLCRNALNQISTCTVGNLIEQNNAYITTLAALREQHAQIELQQQQLKQQQILIDGLRKLVCQTNPQADVCREEK